MDRETAATSASWPEHDGPLLFLLDASSGFERDILSEWLDANRPPGLDPGTVQVASIPPSRRRRRKHRVDPKIEAFLRADDDPLVVPLRVIWRAPERDGVRRVGWRDLFVLGDPRDPDPLRQRFIRAVNPERCNVVVGAPAFASDLVERWAEPAGRGRGDGTGLGDYVALQAWLALERTEREIRGGRYKVPKFLREALFDSHPFAQGIARLAREEGQTYDQVARRSYRYLREMAATHSPYVIDLVAGATRWLVSKAYTGLRYDRERLHELFELSRTHPIAFLPSHKSNFDHLALGYALYENELPPNHTAGGINLNFFPVGMLIRRAGVFFIRRSFKGNDVYKFVLHEYLAYLLEKRFSLEWFIEGGRSRSGKLRAPRYGVLSYVVDAYDAGRSEDVMLIPVSIAYDQITELGEYTAEQKGRSKERESLSWLIRTIRGLRRRLGTIHLTFGEPISLADRIGQPGALSSGEEDKHLVIQKLAFEVCTGINRSTPVTPISLVTLALLGAGDRALNVDEVLLELEPYVESVKRRDLPTTETVSLDTPARVQLALDDLVDAGVVARFVGPTDTFYRIGPEQHLEAAYYRNTIIHFFVNAAIVELALVGTTDLEPAERQAAFWEETMRLRDLLKFEFFFSDKARFTEEIEQELEMIDPDWRNRLAAGDVRSIINRATTPLAGTILRPFLEAYQVVADCVVGSPAEDLDRKRLTEDALKLGKQYLLRREQRNPESVSTVIYDSALDLAANRGLLEVGDADGDGIAAGRSAFAAELSEVLTRFDLIDALVAGRRAGLIA